ncbi:2OG-Fe dioxygenase family protein [Zwartia vadi]|uniref:2OG-Fe dioxygenase family protein n=1 Tax=Zwartia vadi TaxID=3058168 RepID=UPI0025B62756|nr:2OG-Fe dioxygenase family protein [Zwartia vadi]MDN3988574.1 2OG-Fe dioxygenase family protein [Zwartia vadi]
MSIQTLQPPLTAASALTETIKKQGFAVLSPQSVAQLSGASLDALDSLEQTWTNLAPDEYLKDGGRYRYRRHSSYIIHGEQISTVAHRAHWQPLSYNALHGGMHRWFEPVETQVSQSSAWQALLRFLGRVASELYGEQTWFAEAHQFRIDTADGIGRPTPEGAHRDGVHLVAVFLVGRHHIKGGETRVFDMATPFGQRFTLTEPWSVLILDDERVIHETTPIQPDGQNGWRDTLVVTLRAQSFLDDPDSIQS